MKRMKNDGFTLVELLVIVVIIGIITAVTISGIISYVNTARLNTDINNASYIQKTLGAVFASSSDLYDNSYRFQSSNEKLHRNNGNAVICFHWSEYGKLVKEDNSYYFVDENGNKQSNADWGSWNIESDKKKGAGRCFYKVMYDFDNNLELPKCQSGTEFCFIVYFNSDGTVRKTICTIDCIITDEGTVDYGDTVAKWQ